MYLSRCISVFHKDETRSFKISWGLSSKLTQRHCYSMSQSQKETGPSKCKTWGMCPLLLLGGEGKWHCKRLHGRNYCQYFATNLLLFLCFLQVLMEYDLVWCGNFPTKIQESRGRSYIASRKVRLFFCQGMCKFVPLIFLFWLLGYFSYLFLFHPVETHWYSSA